MGHRSRTLPNSADPALRAKVAPNQDGHLTLEEYRNGLAKKDNAEPVSRTSIKTMMAK
ncbi:MAG: hypothetical protein LW645_14325 [Verrucomicrobiaceae bacterium]|nr:hypothetical protein [Verrucomicrobiaceae bacterium]